MKKLRLPAVTAESAFFYLTLAIAGWYLSWTLMFMILLEDRMSIMSLLLFLLPLLPTAFGEIVAARFVASSEGNRRVFKFAAAGIAVLFAAAPPVMLVAGDIYSPWLWPIWWGLPAAFAWLMIAGTPPRARKAALTSAVLWTIAFAVLGTVALWTTVDFKNALTWETVDYRGRPLGEIAALPAPWMIAFRILDAIGYNAGLLLGIAALIGAWLASGITFAKAAQISFGRCFSRRVWALLILLGVGYAAALALGILSEVKFRNMRETLEKRFGRTLDIAGFRKWYETGRKIDNDFWLAPEIQCPEDRNSLFCIDTSWAPNNCGPWGEFPEPMLREMEKRVESYDIPAKLAAALDAGVLPHVRPRFRTGEFEAARQRVTDIIGLNVGLPFTIDILAWRIRFAVDKRDGEKLRIELRRLENAVGYITENAYLITGDAAYWVRDRCRARVIGSGLLTDAELLELCARLAREEAAMPELVNGELYIDALNYFDVLRRLLDHRAYYPELPKLQSGLSAWAVFFPALRYSLIGYLGSSPLPESLEAEHWWKHDILRAPIYLRRLARLRALRVLVAVELEKRRTGKYPAELKDPPLDPFTEKPMKYRVGKIEYEVDTPSEEGGRTTIRRTGNGVAVWSVGKNRRDDDGICDYYGDRDDIRLLIVTPDGKP